MVRVLNAAAERRRYSDCDFACASESSNPRDPRFLSKKQKLILCFTINLRLAKKAAARSNHEWA
jgi:hypothetical protein